MATAQFDVGIIGGGPAGSGMASYLAKAGPVLRRPRARALPPRARRRVARAIVHPGLQRARASGTSWSTPGSRVSTARSGPRPTPSVSTGTTGRGSAPTTTPTSASTEREQPGVDENYTFHVDRGKFDLMLLQHAHELGAQVYEGVNVKKVDFSDETPEIRFDMGREEMGVRVRMRRRCERSAHARRQPARLESEGSGLRPVRDPHVVRRATIAARSRGTARTTTSTSTSCRSVTAGSGRFRSPTTSRASAS